MALMMKYVCYSLVVLVSCDLAISQYGPNKCTKMEAQTIVQTFVEESVCNKSYTEPCGMFTSTYCTYYEIVPCLLEKNKTITKYVIVTSCCNGFKWDPNTKTKNETCIRDTEKEDKPEEVTTESEFANSASHSVAEKLQSDQNSPNVSHTELGSLAYDRIRFVEDKESLYLGLSHGAYAGIICFFAFLICVVILIILNVRKRHIRRQAKDDVEETPSAESAEMSERLMVSEQA